jgi:Tol biopolymer transport system component
VSDILSNARVMYHDSLDDPSLANWTYETGVLQTADGVLQIQGVANRANQVRPKQDFYGGDAALALFKYDAGANPYLFLETGEWETPTYKRGGISADSYNSVFLTEMYVGTSQVGETPLLGDNTAASSTWHYLLLAIGQDGEFVAQVWPRDDPSRRAEYRHTFGQEWVGHPWTLVLQTDSGNLYIDSYTQIAFSSIVGSTSESIPEGRIAFVSDRDGNLEIYVMNADGSGITNLTNHPGEDRDPAWSPDGTRIAFSSDRGGNEDIWVMNADGSGLVNLTNDPNADRTPAWSPDGTRIAFSSDRAGKGFDDIWVMNADGTEPIQLTDNAANNGGPCWSPDGQRIAFTSGLYSTQNIVVMNADGSEQEVRTSLSINFEPSWSPDGRRIVFGSRRTGNEEIYIMNADGSEQTNLTNNPAIEWYPSWLPDGKHVVFMSDRDGNGEIYIMDADGSNPVRLTVNPAEDSFPAWGP